MKKTLILATVAALAGCASTQVTPEQVCQSVNPDPNMLALSGPASLGSGFKVGSLGATVKDGRCEISSAIYVDTERVAQAMSRPNAIEFIQTDAFHQSMVAEMTERARESLRRYPPNTVRFRHQYLPTPPMRPFIVVVEN